MLSHKWDSLIDWQYCQLDNCQIVNNKVTLASNAIGTIISDIRDSTTRINNYCEILPKINVQLGMGALLYVRSGYSPEYNELSWSNWKLINEPSQRMEYTLSLTSNKIIVDYNIKSIDNIYCINNSEYQNLAMNLNTIYLTPLTDADANNPAYSYLWSGVVDKAIVDFAKVDQAGEPLTTYAQNATFVDNVITLSNPLPDDNVIVIVKYVPRNFIYSENNARYIQFKVDLTPPGDIYFKTRDSLYFSTRDGSYLATRNDFTNENSGTPIVTSITINYCLNFQTELEDIFPKFFRRL